MDNFKKQLTHIKRYAEDTFCDDRECADCGGCADGEEYFEIEKKGEMLTISYRNKTAGISRFINLQKDALMFNIGIIDEKRVI